MHRCMLKYQFIIKILNLNNNSLNYITIKNQLL